MNLKQKLAAMGLSSAIVLAGGTLVGPFEGYQPKAYKDIVGVWTQCYGNTHDVNKARLKTQDECSTELAEQLVIHNKEMKAPVRVPMTDYQEAAFTSLVYNVGATNWYKSTALKKLNEGKYTEACAAATLFNKAGGRVVQGLVNRRQEELKVCLGNNQQAIEEARRIVALYKAEDFEDVLQRGGRLGE